MKQEEQEEEMIGKEFGVFVSREIWKCLLEEDISVRTLRNV